MSRLVSCVLAFFMMAAVLANTPLEPQLLTDQQLQAQVEQQDDQELTGLEAGPVETGDDADYD